MLDDDQKAEVIKLMKEIRSGDTDAALKRVASNLSLLNVETPLGTVMHSAARYADGETVASLISMGGNINVRGGVSGGAPINGAASEGNLEVVEVLLDSGCELDTEEPERNPLFAAIHNGHTDVVLALLNAGIDYTLKYTGSSMKDMDAKAFAIEWGRADIAALLDTRAEQDAAPNP